MTARRALLAGLLLAACAAPARRAGAPKPAAPRAAAAAPVKPADLPPAPAVSDNGAPLIIAPLANLNDFTLLANGGFDPGWRVGFDTAWVVQLPPAPAGKWKRAFLGAKLGRAKMERVPGRPPWEKRRITGEIDIAVSGEPLWPHSRRFPLARHEDIPLEADPDNATDGVGEARWFWVEVPVKHVSMDAPNFVVLFSPSASLDGTDRSPVLAAGPRVGKEKSVNAWISNGRRGQPPLGTAEVFKTPVNTYAPAVALKLVPGNDHDVKVSLVSAPEKGQVLTIPFQIAASVQGADVSRAWVQVSTDTRSWADASPALLTPPYTFTLSPAALPAGEAWLRVQAVDAWENTGLSEERPVIVSSPAKK